MEKQRFFTLSFISLLFAIAVTALYLLSPFAKPLLWAAIFTLILTPAHNFLRKRVKNNTFSALIITSVVVFAFIVPLITFGIVALKELVELTRHVVERYKHLSPDELQRQLMSLPIASHILKHLPQKSLDPHLLSKALLSNLKMIANLSASQLKSMIITTGTTLTKLFIFVFALFFLLKDSQTFAHHIYRFTPLEEEDKRDILSSIYTTTLSVVYGTVGTALAQGTASLAIYTVLGVPYPYVWALATAYASFIPPFGASIVWLPIAAYLTFKVSWVKGLIMLILGLLIISSMDNIIKPLIMKNRVHAPYIILFFAIFGGLLKFGFIGMFLGPILFNLLFTLAKIYEQKFIGKNPQEN